jgi:hypothetical protein
MRTLIWILVGWLSVAFWTAVGSRFALGHVIPDMAVITIVFLALRREPIVLAVSAICLGYLVGRQAVAPVGLHESSLVACAVAVYLVAGHLAGSGGFFFAMVSGAAAMLHHAILFLLVYWMRGSAGFSSWATAILLPSGFATFVVSWASYPFMQWLERRFTQDRSEELSWR